MYIWRFSANGLVVDGNLFVKLIWYRTRFVCDVVCLFPGSTFHNTIHITRYIHLCCFIYYLVHGEPLKKKYVLDSGSIKCRSEMITFDQCKLGKICYTREHYMT